MALVVGAMGELEDSVGAKHVMLPSIDCLHEMSGPQIAVLLKGFARAGVADDKVRQHLLKNFIRRRHYQLPSVLNMMQALVSLKGMKEHPHSDLTRSVELLQAAVGKECDGGSSSTFASDIALRSYEEAEEVVGDVVDDHGIHRWRDQLIQSLVQAMSAFPTANHDEVLTQVIPFLRSMSLQRLAAVSEPLCSIRSSAESIRHCVAIVAAKVYHAIKTSSAEIESLAPADLAHLLRVLGHPMLEGESVLTYVKAARNRLLQIAISIIDHSCMITVIAFLRCSVEMELTDPVLLRHFCARVNQGLGDGLDDNPTAIAELLKSVSTIVSRGCLESMEDLQLATAFRTVLTRLLNATQRAMDRLPVHSSVSLAHQSAKLVESGHSYLLPPSFVVSLDNRIATLSRRRGLEASIALFSSLSVLSPTRPAIEFVARRIGEKSSELVLNQTTSLLSTMARCSNRTVAAQLLPRLTPFIDEMPIDDGMKMLLLTASHWDILTATSFEDKSKLLEGLKQFVSVHLHELPVAQLHSCVVACLKLQLDRLLYVTDSISLIEVGAMSKGPPVDLTFSRKLEYRLTDLVSKSDAAFGECTAVMPLLRDLRISSQLKACSEDFPFAILSQLCVMTDAMEQTDIRPEAALSAAGNIMQLPSRFGYDSLEDMIIQWQLSLPAVRRIVSLLVHRGLAAASDASSTPGQARSSIDLCFGLLSFHMDAESDALAIRISSLIMCNAQSWPVTAHMTLLRALSSNVSLHLGDVEPHRVQRVKQLSECATAAVVPAIRASKFPGIRGEHRLSEQSLDELCTKILPTLSSIGIPSTQQMLRALVSHLQRKDASRELRLSLEVRSHTTYTVSVG